MFAYDMPLYRPPSEGDNLIIQAALGCSFNQCRFCAMYKTKDFAIRPLARVRAEIEVAARVWPEARRVFVADGDALVLPMAYWREMLDCLAACFPGLNRVSCYATPKNLLDKSADELAELKARKLSLVYLGIETGAPRLLKAIIKGATPATIAQALAKAHDAGIKVSATVILGVGGKSRWQEHIDGTIALVNQAPPNFLSTLQLTLDPDMAAAYYARFEEGFTPQDDGGILVEQETLIAGLTPPRPVIFRSNHASNALALAGTLPKDRARLLAELAAARAGTVMLRPAFIRGL